MIGEIFKLAVDLDYADEIGRRKMFQLVREYLGFRLFFSLLAAGAMD